MIKIICVGKIKEKYLVDLVKDYKDRINKYHKIDIIEILDSNIEEEKNKILNQLKEEYVIILDIQGEKLNSIEFAKKINDLFINGKSNITFVIGSSEGLHNDIKDRANYSLSFSNLTMPHGLFRGVLLEQIYRSFKIINNETYHK